MREIELGLKPELFKLPRGEWLATTGKATRIRIGIVGATEIEARDRFNAALARWKELSEETE